MADDADEAAERTDAFTAAALRKVLAPVAPANSNGICRICGERIESERMAVLPHTHHCSECAAAVEEDRARVSKRGW